MNPYEPSQIAELQSEPESELITGSPWPVWRMIFAEWEQRRLIYNGVLIMLVLVGIGIQGVGPFLVSTVVECVVAGAAANCCYFAGPLVESYVSWLQQRRVGWGKYLFIAGLGFSVVVTVIALMIRGTFLQGAL